MNRTICERPINKSAILRPIGPVFRRSKALFQVCNVLEGLQVLQNENAMKICNELRENASESTMLMKMYESTAAGSDHQFQTRSSKVFACQGMRNIVQGPPGCYECVAIISSQELTMTRWSNRRYDIVNNTSLLRWILSCSHFWGNKTLRSSSIPQICLMRCIRINWRRETRRREEGLIVVVIGIDVNL